MKIGGRAMEAILNMKGIVKSFSGVEVLHSVDFELFKGEVHALMGENGAGKSTLMNILMGIHRHDAGEILIDGKEVNIISHQQSLKAGIAMIHQELNPVPDMTIAENFYLGREINKFFIVNNKLQKENAAKYLKSLGLNFDVECKMRNLSVSATQMIEIAKNLSYGSRIIIMDEPTSALADSEVDRLFKMISLLKSKNVSIVYITHKLDELNRIADRVTVLRDGSLIGTKNIKEVDNQSIIRMMVGREITEVFPSVQKEIGETVLSVKNLTRGNEIKDISFDLKKGEILGIAGLMGSGRTELVTTIFGERKYDKGNIFINGNTVSIRSTENAVRNKIALVPEDRKLQGLNLIGSVLDNILIVSQKKFSKANIISKKKNIKVANSMIKELSIKVKSCDQRVESLSGGNQQKVVIAKWLLSGPEIIILDEPTRGIDIGAKTEIYKLINKLALAGKSIILISSEMPEIIGLCDRVLVLSDGRLNGVLMRDELTQERIMSLASGTRWEGCENETRFEQ
jgi:inositol transport system ATP-binding protein